MMSNNQQPKKQTVIELNQDHDEINDYLMWSIFNIFFCNFCLGLAALKFSIKTKKYNSEHPRNAETKKYSEIAYIFNAISTIVGINGLILYIISRFKYA